MRPWRLGLPLVLALACLTLTAGILHRTGWSVYGAWLTGCSATALAAYTWDKVQARLDGPRIPESLLHALALTGGFAGAAVGMVLLGHKSNRRRHSMFAPVLLLSAIGHALLAYSLWAGGR